MSSFLRPSVFEAGNISVQISLIGFKNPQRISSGKVGEEILDGTCVGIDGFGAFPFENESLNEGASSSMISDARIMFPLYLLNIIHSSTPGCLCNLLAEAYHYHSWYHFSITLENE